MPKASGEKHHNSVLTDEQVRQMRSEYIPYVMGYKKLAKKYGLAWESVRAIVNYETRREA